MRDFLQRTAGDVFGILAEPAVPRTDEEYSRLMEFLIAVRARARGEKSWALSDFIRDGLRDLGIQLEDNIQNLRSQKNLGFNVTREIGDTLAGSAPAAAELTLSRAPEHTFVARSAPVTATGGGGAVLVLHDITDLRRLDQVRRDFVANVSHELRTPLTAIRGYVEALADDPVSPEDRARFLEVIARHASRMERLVRDLLRLASLDARQETVERGDCLVSSWRSTAPAPAGRVT